MTMEPTNQFSLGVDLAQESFDAAIAPAEAQIAEWRRLKKTHFDFAPESPEGVAALMEWVGKHASGAQCARVVVESTGKISHRFAKAMKGHGLPEVIIINPKFIKHFAIGAGVREKTDPIDAQMIAFYAQIHQPKPAKPRSKCEEKLQEHSRMREAYVQDLLAWRNRRREAVDDAAKKSADRTIEQSTWRAR